MPTDSEPWAIDARGLTKTFGKVSAVRGVTLQVPTGTIFAFLGPNGSGKSTTVKLLTGLLKPTAGEARVSGRVVSVEDLELRREIGILPEDDALFPDLTIWEHLELCGRLYGLSRHARAQSQTACRESRPKPVCLHTLSDARNPDRSPPGRRSSAAAHAQATTRIRQFTGSRR